MTLRERIFVTSDPVAGSRILQARGVVLTPKTADRIGAPLGRSAAPRPHRSRLVL